MKKEILIDLVKQGFSQRAIAKKLNSSHTNVRYWLKKHELKIIKKERVIFSSDGVATHRICGKCGNKKEIEEFYKNGNRPGTRSACKKCENKYFVERLRKIKRKMVEYKGGECVDCGVTLNDKNAAIFDFHHLDPNEKDPRFNRIKYQSWENIKKEIEKCILVCSNCHRIIEAEF